MTFHAMAGFALLSFVALGCGGDPIAGVGEDGGNGAVSDAVDAGDTGAHLQDAAPDRDVVDAADADATHDAHVDGHDASDASDASDADLDAGDADADAETDPDASDTSDASDADDAADASDAGDRDASDAADASDANDAGDASDAACAPDSGPSTCGINGRGTTNAVCNSNGEWDVTCHDTDACRDNTIEHGFCGINARGTSSRTCAGGQWSATSCVDPDECHDGAKTNDACGINLRGTSTRTCASGHWGPSATCVDPDVCRDGATTQAACGRNLRGTSATTCASGKWGAAICVDPDVCVDGAQSTFHLACGPNNHGKTSQTCAAGHWGPQVCADTDVCTNGTSTSSACGVNGRGTSTSTCANGQWPASSCVDPDACKDGATKQSACGVNGRGTATTTCSVGHWGASVCVDTDECADGAQTHGACGLNNRGTSTTACAGGRWGAPACVDTDECTDGAQSQRACAADSSGTSQLACTHGKWSASACLCPAGLAYTCSNQCLAKRSRIYVSSAAHACEDGLSWATALSSPMTALDRVTDRGEVWIAQGVYVTTAASPTFTMDRPVSIYGGFAGTEVMASQRDAVHPTTLQRGPTVTSTASAGFSVLTIAPPIDVVLDGFTVADGAATRGGGLNIDQARVNAHNLGFAYNHSQIEGGAIYIGEKGTIVIDQCTFDSNQGGAGGGAVSASFLGTGVVVRDSSFTSNVAFSGGALNNVQTVTRSSFIGNSALAGSTGGPSPISLGGDGGAISSDRGITISDSVLQQNTASAGGGAISADGDVRIDRTAFRRNTAGDGGAFSFTDADTRIRFSSLEENSAPFGSAIHGFHGAMDVANTTFISNDASRGAAIDVAEMDLSMANVVFAMNHGGAVSYSGYGNVRISHASFVDNDSTQPGAAVRISSSFTPAVVAIDNSLFARNTAPSARHIAFDPADNVTVRGSCIEFEGWPGSGSGNIATSPIFESATSYVPAATSPTVETALLAAVPADVDDVNDNGDVGERLPWDLKGGARIVGTPDMGAYER